MVDGISMFTIIGVLGLIVFTIIYLNRCRLRKSEQVNIHGWVKTYDHNGRSKIYSGEGIVSKPDIVVIRDRLIEMKSSMLREKPYKSNIYQLVGNVLSYEGSTGGKIKQATLQYKNGSYNLPITDDLKNQVRASVSQMRQHLYTNTIPKGTSNQNKCRACELREECLDIGVGQRGGRQGRETPYAIR